MSTCAVISRIQLIEAPYLNEFVHWYLSLGFDRIYFINTEPQSLNKIKRHVSASFERKVTYLNVDKAVQNEPSRYLLALIEKQIVEDFILNVDSDEYLYIDSSRFGSIKDFLEHYGEKFYIFNWINVPYFGLFSDSMVEYLHSVNSKMYFNKTRKSLGSVKALHGIDWHVMNGGKKGQRLDPFRDRCFVFHFIVRSVTHQLLKQFHQKMGNFKDRNQMSLGAFLSASKDELSITDYPFRMLAIILLKRIVENNNARPSLHSLIEGIQKTPEIYRANMQLAKHDMLQMLRSLFPDKNLENSLNLDQYLNAALELPGKLDAGRLPAQVCNYSDTEELRVTMDRIYKSSSTPCIQQPQ